MKQGEKLLENCSKESCKNKLGNCGIVCGSRFDNSTLHEIHPVQSQALVERQVINPIGNDLAQLWLDKVVGVNLPGLFLGSPFWPVMIKLSNQLFTAITSGIGTGFSNKSEFAVVANDAAAAASQALIVYSQGTGDLFYNQNGVLAGLGAGGVFATQQTNASRVDPSWGTKL